MREDPILTQSEFPLLISQRALGHYLQIQHWFGSPGRPPCGSADGTGAEETKQQVTHRPRRPAAALFSTSTRSPALPAQHHTSPDLT